LFDVSDHVKATTINFKKPHVERVEAERREKRRSRKRRNDGH
jgi:hypothetical protein